MDNMEKERDYIRELDEYVNEKKEEYRLPSEAIVVLELGMQHHQLSIRREKLKEALDVLTQEKLVILSDYLAKIEEVDRLIRETVYDISCALDNMIPKLTQKKWVTFVFHLQNKSNKEKLRIITSTMTNKQKETFYEVIRSEELKNKEDVMMIESFEQQIGYSFEFAKKMFIKEVDSSLAPFEDYLRKHVKEYTPKVKATLTWLQEDVFGMKLHDSLFTRYAEATVRRLSIGEDIPNQEEKKQYKKEAVKELEELLRHQQQKKSS